MSETTVKPEAKKKGRPAKIKTDELKEAIEVLQDTIEELEADVTAETPATEPEPVETPATEPEPTAEVAPVVVETDTPGTPEPEAAVDTPKPLAQRIKDLATRATPSDIRRALSVTKRGGTVGVTKDGKLTFAPGVHPDRGGKQQLLRKGNIRAFVSEL